MTRDSTEGNGQLTAPKSYAYLMWLPITGDSFARKIARAARVRQLRLLLIPIFLVGVFPYQVEKGFGESVLALGAIIVLFGGVLALTVGYRRMLQTVERDFHDRLIAGGMPIATRPSFRSPDAFEWWCVDNDIDRKQLTVALQEGNRLDGA